MKKFILLLLTILLLPVMVYAEDKKVILESISLNGKSDNVIEVSPATIEDNKIKLDFKMYEVEDYIEYKIKVKNNSNETLEIDNSSVASPVKYIKYSVDSSKIIKSGEEKDIILRITYISKVDDSEFVSAKYTSTNKIPLVFKSPSIINPETIKNLLPIILVISIVIGYSIYNKKKINFSKAMILLLLLGLIPNIVSALEEEIIIEPNIMIRKVKPTHCTFGGQLVQGAEYTNGQYTYRYMQEKKFSYQSGFTSWENIESEGWGVSLTDEYSEEDVTTPLCSTIDDKPLVSTSYMFGIGRGQGANTTSIDTSNFDTENVTNMAGMFYGVRNITNLDVSVLDTSKVIDMESMFAFCFGLTDIDLSNFDTSKVTDMSYMFRNCSLIKLNLNTFNTSEVTDMSYMFSDCSLITKLNLSHFDTSKVTDMTKMFYFCYSLVELNLGGWDTSNVLCMDSMFYECRSLTSLDLSNFNNNKVTDMELMFSGCSSLTSINLNNFGTSNVTNMYCMFYDCSSLTSLDLSSFDTSNVTDIGFMFHNCTSLTIAYGRTQADCDKLNGSYSKSPNVNFVVKV